VTSTGLDARQHAPPYLQGDDGSIVESQHIGIGKLPPYGVDFNNIGVIWAIMK
jgi:hypothetical protein